MSENNNEFGAFLSGFLIGGLIGAATALIMAPQSGEETRTMIKERSGEVLDRADAEVKRIKAQADQTITDLRKQAEELQKKTTESFDEYRARLQTAIEEGVEAAKKVRGDKGTETEIPAAE